MLLPRIDVAITSNTNRRSEGSPVLAHDSAVHFGEHVLRK